MKTFIASTVIAAMGIMSTSVLGVPQESTTVRQERTTGQVNPAGQLNQKAVINFRASKLLGYNIQNPQGESLGEVSDLVFDPVAGKIRYVAVTYGGFLGLGNKMFAVPYEAFKFMPDRDDATEMVVVLNISQQQLEGAQGFDEENWPDFGNQNFTDDLDKRYGINREQGLRDTDGNRFNTDETTDLPIRN